MDHARPDREYYWDEGTLAHMMSFLDAPSLCAASMTCRTWNTIANDDYLWRPLLEKSPNPMLNRFEVPAPIAGEREGSGSGSRCCHADSASSSRHASFKEAYAMGSNWRRGRGSTLCVRFPGSSWNCAARLHPDSGHAVFASAGLGSIEVLDLSSGQRCPKFLGVSPKNLESQGADDGDELQALFSSVAIAPSCKFAAFGGFDGTVNVYDVRRGTLQASATVPAPQPAVTSLGFSCGILGAGLADGRVALSPLRTWGIGSDPQRSACSCSTGHGMLAPNHGWQGTCAAQDGVVPRRITGPWVTCNIGADVEVRRLKGECGPGAGPVFVAGTSGGHVMVIDAEVGRLRSSLVGSCSCPVNCLSLHCNLPGPAMSAAPGQQPSPQALTKVVYAGFNHRMIGNGHYNAVYVWDALSQERVALLHPGGSSLRNHRGGRGVCCRRMQSAGDLSSMVRAVWADGWKVAVSAGKAVTVFETRTWKPLYELSFPVASATKSQSCGALGQTSSFRRHSIDLPSSRATGSSMAGGAGTVAIGASPSGFGVFPSRTSITAPQAASAAVASSAAGVPAGPGLRRGIRDIRFHATPTPSVQGTQEGEGLRGVASFVQGSLGSSQSPNASRALFLDEDASAHVQGLAPKEQPQEGGPMPSNLSIESSMWALSKCSLGSSAQAGDLMNAAGGYSPEKAGVKSGEKMVVEHMASASPEKNKVASGEKMALEHVGSTSPEKSKGAAGEKVVLEEVSESPGALTFFGDTLMVGLKNDAFSLVTFRDPASRGAAPQQRCLLNIKRL